MMHSTSMFGTATLVQVSTVTVRCVAVARRTGSSPTSP
ncbi:Uncharacterised protein [Segatella copri]|nr:Uncharacterised protein [Segatella copri]